MIYSQYLTTKHWKNKREEVKSSWGNRCRFCFTDINIHIHHKRYKDINNKSILYNEPTKYLIPLCSKCHGLWHKYHGKRIMGGGEWKTVRNWKKAGHTLDNAIRFCVFDAKEFFSGKKIKGYKY